MDRHKLWRIVSNNAKHLEEHAPEGYEAVVDVYLAGRADPIRLGVVETSQAEDNPWMILQTYAAGTEAAAEAYDPDVTLVLADAGLVARVEIHYERQSGKKPPGFQHHVTSNEP